jgi:ATP-binding cassette, subfamily B, bacterial
MSRTPAQRAVDLGRIRRALALVWRSAPGWTLLNIILLFIQSVLPLAGLYLLKLVVDAVSSGVVEGTPAVGFDRILLFIGLAGAVTVAGLLARAVGSYAAEAQAHLVTDQMLDHLHAKAVGVDYAYYEDSRYYDTLHRAQQEAPTRPTRLLTNVTQVGQSSITTAGILVLLATVHWLLSALIVVAVVPALLLRVRHSRRLHQWQRQRAGTERQVNYYGWLIANAEAAKEIRIFGLGGVLRERFRGLRKQLREERLRLTRARNSADAGAQTAASLVVFGSLAFVAFHAYAGTLTLGDMVMYFAAIQRGQSLVQSLFAGLGNLYEDSLFLAMVDEFLELEPSIAAPPSPLPVPRPIRSGLVCEGLSFRYPSSDRMILQDVNLEVRPGELVALVGPNGSGKTTLVKLLCRLYDPLAGAIRLDGVDLRAFDPAELRRQFAVVFQDYSRYQLPARDNIWFGDVSVAAKPGRIQDAARRAGADAAIQRLRHGYDTVLGRLFSGGEELSIGEWQKVALARAFLREADVLIVDEPTSSLDAEAEAEVFRALRQLIGGRAAVIISHRLSTVRVATRIYFLEEGRIVESGTHDELMARGGSYARLFGVQAAMYSGVAEVDAVWAGEGAGGAAPAAGRVDRSLIEHDS